MSSLSAVPGTPRRRERNIVKKEFDVLSDELLEFLLGCLLIPEILDFLQKASSRKNNTLYTTCDL